MYSCDALLQLTTKIISGSYMRSSGRADSFHDRLTFRIITSYFYQGDAKARNWNIHLQSIGNRWQIQKELRKTNFWCVLHARGYMLCYLHRRESSPIAFKIICILLLTSWFNFKLSFLWKKADVILKVVLLVLFELFIPIPKSRVNSFFGRSLVVWTIWSTLYSSSFPV